MGRRGRGGWAGSDSVIIHQRAQGFLEGAPSIGRFSQAHLYKELDDGRLPLLYLVAEVGVSHTLASLKY